MGSPAAGSADAAVEGASDADSAERPGAGEGGHRPVMQDNQLDLDIKGLLERRKALRQERQQEAKTLKKAHNFPHAITCFKGCGRLVFGGFF